VTPGDALRLLQRVCALPGHAFWPDDLSLAELGRTLGSLIGHRQVTDAYLVALAASREGVLATLDRGVAAVSGKTPGSVEFIS
jgi:predicted nucleic acid-binding protein